MLHNSSADFVPALVVQTNGMYQVRFNVTERTFDDQGIARQAWDYEYAETATLDYGAFVDAIIGTHYGKDAEIAMLNKAFADPADIDYAEYNAFRAEAKIAAKAAIEWWGSC